MKFLISYFYQIRFLKDYMIPFSTAKWDPKWFHTEDGYTFFDKHNVINGLRLDVLNPINTDCSGPDGCKYKPENCPFLRDYEQQLHGINFNGFVTYCEGIARDIQQIRSFVHEPIIVLLVYETPGNPCSERVVLKKWFHDNGQILEEFDKEKKYD